MSETLATTSDANVLNEISGMHTRTEKIAAGLKRRHAVEKRFRAYGLMGIGFAVACVFFLFYTIIGNALPGFQETRVTFEIEFSKEIIDPEGSNDPKVIGGANYRKIVRDSFYALFPNVSGRRDKRELAKIISSGSSFIVRDMVLANPSLIGTTTEISLPLSADMDQFFKGGISAEVAESERRVSDKQIGWLRHLIADKRVDSVFNTTLFTAGDSREPELAGIAGAVMGSLYTMMVTLALSFPDRCRQRRLPGGIRAEKPLDAAHRGQHQQPRRRAVHRVRPVGARGVPEFLRAATLGAARGRHGAGADDAADRDNRRPRRAQGGAAVDPRSRFRHGRVALADHRPPRAAAGHARHPDRHHHRHGPGAW